ncbi:glycosyltransferase family 32 protein [[Candida] arabinofermentans NRRL YB-2248]|uniref:Glycosyltransferase family 32 protein n=1 Tax=[Candida] arabinofermentans NRRL YB-2248 TaxID=983967 RepID=A0A1E4SW79_9ASCO|nr:glycosyltransferase family 32 protein [[Candida] arabinofermentans NRRL YB-2248]
MFTIESRLSYYFPFKPLEEIENNIWQLWTVKSDDKSFPEDCKIHIERWRSINDNYNHNLISIQEAEEMVVDYLRPNVPEVVDALRSLPNERLKFEFLKYLIIYISGGLYSDIDTINIKPLKYWYDSKIIGGKLMVGITSDYNDLNWEKLYNRRLSFSNNLFKAKSHHPFLAKLIARITFICFTQQDSIKETNWDQVFQNLDANGEPLIQFTGSSIFTDTLFEYLNNLNNAIFIRVAKNDRDKDLKPIVGPQIPENQRFSYRSFSGIIAPTQIDDVIIMPQITFNGFENSQKDEYDDNDEKQGYEKFYYARPLSLTIWSNKKQKLESN